MAAVGGTDAATLLTPLSVMHVLIGDVRDRVQHAKIAGGLACRCRCCCRLLIKPSPFRGLLLLLPSALRVDFFLCTRGPGLPLPSRHRLQLVVEM